MKLGHSVTITKIHSKGMKALNVRLDIIKHLEANIGRTLSDINHSKIFFDPPPRVMKTKINKWYVIKSFSRANETINKTKSPQNERKYFQMK